MNMYAQEAYKPKKKPKKPVPKKNMYFFGGICLCLFSVCLIMNVWYLARIITFLPSYLFGMGAYAIYLFLYAEGMCLLFREKAFKFSNFLSVLGGVVFFVTLLMGLSLGYSMELPAEAKDNLLNIYNQNYFDFGKYLTFTNVSGELSTKYASCTPLVFYKAMPIGLGASELQDVAFGGGLIGYLLVSLTNSIGVWFSWIVVVLLLLLSIFLIFNKFFIGLIRRTPVSYDEGIEEERYDEPLPTPVTRVPLAEAPAINSAPTTPRMFRSSSTPEPARPVVQSQPQVTRAPIPTPMSQPSYRQEPVAPTPAPQPEPVVEKRQSIMAQPSVPYGPNYSTIGVFTPARFIRPGAQNATQASAPAPMASPFVQEKPQTAESALLEANERQTKAEQTYLDFDAEPEVVEEQAVQAPPMVEQPVMPTPAPVPTPVMASPAPAMQQGAIQSQDQVRKPIKWIPPTSEMLDDVEVGEALDKNQRDAEDRKVAIDSTFADFRIGAHVDSYTIGPSVTRFNIKYDPNVSSKSIDRIVDDISIRLGGVNARFQPIVEGLFTSGLEVPNEVITTVSFKEVFLQLPDVKKHPLAVAFGKNIQGEVVWADLNKFPHALVAGTTGSGKSVFVNSIINTLIIRNSPENLKLLLIDPKQVEMTKYRNIPHLICPVINDASQARVALGKLVDEMNERYSIIARVDGCVEIDDYNQWAEMNNEPKIPYIVCFVDEYADLVDNCKDVAGPIANLGAKARACGIHLVISTQRPSTNIVTGTIKGNLPVHIALLTANVTDSCTILNEGGAEKLGGKGDMLVQTPLLSRVGPVRVQSCYIQRTEMMKIINYLKTHYEPCYDPKFLNLEEQSSQAGQAAVASGAVAESMDSAEEMKYQGIKEWVYGQQYMSMSRIQRECSVGFNRAGRFFNRLQAEGVVSMEVEANRGCRVIRHSDDDTGDDAYCD